MRWWEWAFPIAGIALALWATLPDLPHGCAFDWQAMCGWDAILRFDIILPIVGSIAVWGGVRLWLLRRELEALIKTFHPEAEE